MLKTFNPEREGKEIAAGRVVSQPISPEADISPTEILVAAWYRRWLIVLVVAAALLAGYYYAKSQTRLYTASTEVMLNLEQRGLEDLGAMMSGLSGDWREIESQQKVILSRNLIGNVVDALGLTEVPAYNPWLETEAIAAPPTGLADWLPLDAWRERFLPDWLPLGGDDRADPTAPPPAEKVRQSAIMHVIDQTTVEQSGDSLIFVISVTTPDPERSALIANAIADQYILNQIALKYEATEKAAVWLSNRVAELKEALEDAESAVADFRADNDLIDDEQLRALAARIVSLRQTRREVVDVRDAAQQRLAAIEAYMAAQQYGNVADVTNDPVLGNLAQTIAYAETENERATALARFGSELDGTLERLRREFAQSERSISSLDGLITEAEARRGRQSAARVRLAQLEREADAARVIYESFLSREKETSIQQGAQKADAVVIAEAWVPGAPSYPRTYRLLLVAMAAGIVIAGGIVAGLEALRQTFAEPDELERHTGRQILGLIPKFKLGWGMSVLEYISSRPNSPFVEGVRNLRTSIRFVTLDSGAKVVAFGSSVESEGKSTLSMALAQVSGTQSNSRVLLMDCDLRRRQSTRVLGGRGVPGMIAYFSDKAQLDDIIRRPDGAEFDVIFADRSPKITADIFSSRKFAELMDELRRRYDLIIIDTPPVLALTDARLIMSYVDLALFMVNYKKTRRRPLRAALKSLELSEVGRVALVFNQTDVRRSVGYYGTYYYGRK